MLLQLEWVGSALCLPVPVGRLGRDLMLPSLGIPLCVSVCVCGRVPFNDQLQQPRQIGRDLCVDWKHNDVRLFLLLLPPASGRLVSLPLPHKEIKMKYLLLLIFSFYSAPHLSEVMVVDQGLAQPHLPPGRVINASPSKCR